MFHYLSLTQENRKFLL